MRKTKISIVLLLTLITAACLHKTNNAPISSWERLNVNLAAVAQINLDVAKGVIAAQQSGAITVAQAAPILNYQETVAKDHAAIENILAAGTAQASSRGAEINALLDEIKKQGTDLIASGGLSVKNPKSQQTFTQDLQGIVNLTETVLSDFALVKRD